jgi:hypothetical protein
VEIVSRVGSTAMVVKRKTRNNGNTHCKPVVTRVQPLLKCAPSCRVRTPLDGHERAEAHHTERSLQLNGSHHNCITQLVIHQQQPESQELLPVPHSLLSEPNPAEGMASHSCEAGLSQGHPHIARYHTTTCQLRRGSHSKTPLNPFRRAGLTHVTWGWMI